MLCNGFYFNAVCGFFFQERCWFKTFFPEEFTRFSEGNYCSSQLYTTVNKIHIRSLEMAYVFYQLVIKEQLCNCDVLETQYQSCVLN